MLVNAKTETGTANNVVLIQNNSGNSQNPLSITTYNGRQVSHPATTPTTDVRPLSPEITPPQYDPSSAPAGGRVMGQGVFDSNEIQLAPINSALNLSKEDFKRKNFFLQLKNKLAHAIHLRNFQSLTNTKKYFYDDVYHLEPLSMMESYCLRGCDILINQSIRELIYQFCGKPCGCLTGYFIPNCSSIVWECGCKCIRLPQQVSTDIKLFAGYVALGLVYQYQDQIPILSDKSIKALIDYFTERTLHYIFSANEGDFSSSSIYRMLTHRLVYIDLAQIIILETVTGFQFSLQNLLSTGILTLSGCRYVPAENDSKSRKYFNYLQKKTGFPLYRRGTMDIFSHTNLKVRTTDNSQDISFVPIKDETYKNHVINESMVETESDFWKEAEALVEQFMGSSSEWSQ